MRNPLLQTSPPDRPKRINRGGSWFSRFAWIAGVSIRRRKHFSRGNNRQGFRLFRTKEKS